MVKGNLFKRKKKLKSYNYVDWIIIAFFLLLVTISLIPMLNVLSLSVSDKLDALKNKAMLLPNFKNITLGAYRAVFTSDAVYTSLLVSLGTTVVATLLHMLVSVLGGFAISNRKLPGRTVMLVFLVITMLFSGGLIPGYLTISSYGLIDTFWVMVLPGAVGAYSIIMMKNYIINIPQSLKESAEIDGANPFTILFQIIVPLSIPIIATLSLFCAVGKWNDWATAFFYIKEKKILWPFQNVLQNIVVNLETSNSTGINFSEMGEAFKNALIVISILPVIVLYLFAQKYFIKGIFIGSVKG